MNNITFVFPIRVDSNERLQNLEANIIYLKNIFTNPNIIVIEDETTNFVDQSVNIVNTNYGNAFHKTKIINTAIKNIDNEFVAILDVDLFFSENDYMEAYNKLINNEYDFIFSYNGICWNYNRNFINYIFSNKLIQHNEYSEYRLEHMNNNSVGGSIWCSIENFIKIKGQNENIISWGYEDNEFFRRLHILEKRFYRTSGIAYHLDHPRNFNSSFVNPNLNNNLEEYNRISNMNKQELELELEKWIW